MQCQEPTINNAQHLSHYKISHLQFFTPFQLDIYNMNKRLLLAHKLKIVRKRVIEVVIQPSLHGCECYTVV